MNIVLSWLREFCPTELSADELAEILTAKGAEVEDVVRPWERLAGVVVARVIEVRDHPDSDKLWLARVTTGGVERNVVVGVRNMRPGDLVPLAGPGATVPALAEPLAARTIRGVTSDGMLCSPMELGIAPAHDGILVLPEALSPGEDLKEALGLDEAVIDIEVTPNRPDFLSVIGIAREVAAATGAPLKVPDVSPTEDGESAEGVASLQILDLERCPRYLARIIRGVRHVPSPIRVQARLTAAGMRPISAAIDATNYAMLEFGQPLHPFDLSDLAGPGIVVRRAAAGERLVTLDDIERTFTDDDLLIADADRAVAVAGVMGGAIAEVSESTADILLESASFERRGIQRTRRRLALSTEASLRFERGVDPEAVPVGADRASQLMAEWCDARVLAGSIEVGHAPTRRRVDMRPSRASRLLGFEVSGGDAAGVFDQLMMSHDDEPDRIAVEVPGYRVDLEREVDLIEEVVRLRGYERVPSTLPAVRQAGGLTEPYAFRRRVRRSLAGAGLREIVSFSFASAADLELTGDTDAVTVANPLVADEGFLRTRLIPGLLRAVAHNRSRQVRRTALFEVGTVFRLAGDGVEERPQAALALNGLASSGWTGTGRELDFFDAKGVVEALLGDLHVSWKLDETPGLPFHPGRSALVTVDGQPAAVVGEIQPSVAERLGLGGRVAVAELEVRELMRAAGSLGVLRDIPRFPPVRRDLAFLVDASTTEVAVRHAIAEGGGDLLGTCELFDVYSGGDLPEGKKSLAYALDIRATDRTLTAAEADEVVASIAERVAEAVGGELRRA